MAIIIFTCSVSVYVGIFKCGKEYTCREDGEGTASRTDSSKEQIFPLKGTSWAAAAPSGMGLRECPPSKSWVFPQLCASDMQTPSPPRSWFLKWPLRSRRTRHRSLSLGGLLNPDGVRGASWCSVSTVWYKKINLILFIYRFSVVFRLLYWLTLFLMSHQCFCCERDLTNTFIPVRFVMCMFLLGHMKWITRCCCWIYNNVFWLETINHNDPWYLKIHSE